jgi:hypothetical protein
MYRSNLISSLWLWVLFVFNFCFYSLICQSVFVMLPGRQSLPCYLCSNNTNFSQLAFKQNWSQQLLLIFSFAIHIFVNVKIKMLRYKQQNSFDVLKCSDHLKLKDIVSMESRTISDYLSSFLTMAISSSLIYPWFFINRMNPIAYNQATFLYNLLII